MITTCTSCQARFRLADDKVPWRKIRVRCASCRSVFLLDGTVREMAPPEMAVAEPLELPDRSLVDGLEGFPNLAEVAAAPPIEVPRPAAPVPAPTPLEPSARPVGAASASLRPLATAEVDTAVALADAPRPARRGRRDKTEMLARALVSDILVYNREARDRALGDGNLLEVLGPEIKKSWELYKEKVGASTASSTSYFKDALNEILADGRKLF